ncbi:MAG: hypothetical protein J1G06_00075 [Oscillospiraceae bacterium]|nr:hypothetical protein [Oscillospiraceae bacterium]
MKKLISVILSAAMILAVHVPVSLAEDDVKVIVDGTELQFDVPPVIENDCVLVPVRALAEALNKTVEWHVKDQWQRVTIRGEYGDYFLQFTIGESTMEKQLIPQIHTVELDVPTRIIKDRAFVPLRAVSEALKADVQWNSATRTVNITSSPEPADRDERYDYWYDKFYDDKSFYLDKNIPGSHVPISGSQAIMVSVFSDEPDETYTYEWSCSEGNFESIHSGNDIVWKKPEKDAVYSETAVWKYNDSWNYENFKVCVSVKVTNSKGESVTEHVEFSAGHALMGSIHMPKQVEPFELDIQHNSSTNPLAGFPIMVSVKNGSADDTYTYEWTCPPYGTFEEICIGNDTGWVKPDKDAIYTETATWKPDIEAIRENHLLQGDDDEVKLVAIVKVTNSKGESVTKEIYFSLVPVPTGRRHGTGNAI